MKRFAVAKDHVLACVFDDRKPTSFNFSTKLLTPHDAIYVGNLPTHHPALTGCSRAKDLKQPMFGLACHHSITVQAVG